MMLDYNVGVRQSGILQNYVDYNTGNITPVADEEIHEFWTFTLPVTIGETFAIETRMSGWVGSSAFDRGESGLNYLISDPIFRISNVSGYYLDITSASGAPTSPIPDDEFPWEIFLPAIQAGAK
jgi:hypothetical protein